MISSSIKKALASIDGVTDHLTRYRTASMRYESKLALRGKNDKVSEEPVKEFVLAAAIDAWRSASQDNSFENVSLRHLRVLCCVSEIAVTRTFIDLLQSKGGEISARMTRDLLGVYFAQWSGRSKHQHFETVLKAILRDYSGTGTLMTRWQKHSESLLGDNAPSQLAEHLLREQSSVVAFFSDLQLPRAHAQFSNEVAFKLALLLTSRLDKIANPIKADWSYYQLHVLQEQSFQRDQINLILAQLILVVDSHYGDAGWEFIKAHVREYVLKHPSLGDPRIEEVKWELFDVSAKRAFTSWLAEEDIGVFFELIIKNDPHRRKDYWLKFAKQANNSMLIVGVTDHKLHESALKKFASQGRSYAKGFNLPTSAFILDFGRIAIVEFSEVNNACFVYRRGDLPGLFKTTTAGWKDLKVLKDRDKALHVQSHYRGWEDNLGDYLLKHGVEPID